MLYCYFCDERPLFDNNHCLSMLKRGTASTALLQDVSDSRHTLPLLEEIPGNSEYISLDDNSGEPSPRSSQYIGLSSSSSYLNSERSDLELAEMEVAKSMMSVLLPQAIPLLKRSKKKKKSKDKKKEKPTVSVITTSAHNPSVDGCQGATVPIIIGNGTNRNSSETCVHEGSLCDMVKDELMSKLDEMNYFVADSFEDDAQILGDDTSKSMGVHHHESDDACSREPNENSKLLYGKTEGHAKHLECQVGVQDDANTPDVVYDHEKGQYILSDSLLACLEEEFGGEDSFHPTDYNLCNSYVEELQFEQQYKDLTNGVKNGSSASMDVPHHKDTGNGSIDVCAQASAGQGLAVLSNGECLANVLHAPLHSNVHNDAAKWGMHAVNLTFIRPPPCEESSLLGTRDKEHHTEVPAVDQKENRFHGINYQCGKSDDPIPKSNSSYHSEDVDFIDKYVAFESSDKGRHSNDRPQSISTTEVWPFCDAAKADKGNILGKVGKCQAEGRIGNEDTTMYVRQESNSCERAPLKGENDVFHHQTNHALCSTNCINGLATEYIKAAARGSDHHLELVGCYLHPMPVLSIMLNTKNHSSLYIFVICGLLESCQRFLYVYTTNPEDQQDTPPSFVGYTPLLLPSSEQSSTGNFLFGRSGLQFTPDGQFLVLLGSIRIPFCRQQNIDCLCSMCKLGQREDNSLKIVAVHLGYVSLITKLLPYGTVSCILICEPNYIVATEGSRNLHIWEMVTGWREVSEQYVIPSLGNVGPSVLELRRLPKSSFLIMGHDGTGGFCLWDISKRTLLATFAAPGNIVFQVLPVGLCSLQEDIVHAPVDDIERKLREITVTDMPKKNDRESFKMPPREDIAVWVLISSASVAEYQHDLQAKDHNARWRLALLAKNKTFMGNILDTRVTALDASGNYGFAGTRGGLLYSWELSSGRKLTVTQCSDRGRVSCVAVDAKSGVVAVADGGCQVLLYSEDKVVIDVDRRQMGKWLG